MPNVVKQSAILATIVKLLRAEFGYPVYADEVVDGYQKPCFFITASSTMTTQARNWLEKDMQVAILHIPADDEKNEIHYMDVIDRIQRLFQIGIPAGDRFLHIASVEDDRMGEEQDLLQITLDIPFVEQVVRPKLTTEIMEEITLNAKHKADSVDEERFGGTITKG